MNWEEASKTIGGRIARKYGITDPTTIKALVEAAYEGYGCELENWLHQRR